MVLIQFLEVVLIVCAITCIKKMQIYGAETICMTTKTFRVYSQIIQILNVSHIILIFETYMALYLYKIYNYIYYIILRKIIRKQILHVRVYVI